MNTADLKSLAERAEGVDGHRSARLQEVHDRIRAARRHRRTVGALGAVAMVVVVAGTAIVFRPGDERMAPASDPTPTPTIPSPPVEDTSLDRPLTYAAGQTIHYGDQVVDTDRQIAEVDVVDAGVMYLTQDGELWFTDGSGKRRVDPGTGSYNEGYEAKSAADSSLIAWVRHEGELPIEVVVYDAATQQVVLREPAGPSVWPEHDPNVPYAQALLLTPDVVVVMYSDTNYRRDATAGQVRYVGYNLRTGRRTELSFDEFDQLQPAPPSRVLGWRARSGDPDNIYRGSTDTYRVRDGILTVDVFDDTSPHPLVADPVNPVTGDRLRIEAPAQLPDRTELRLFQWLDDGVFALVGTGPNGREDGALVICTLAEQGCKVAVPGPADWILPGREFYD